MCAPVLSTQRSRGHAPLQVLELLAVERVDGAPVERGIVEPILVARHAVLVVEQHRAHRLLHQHDALLGQPRAHRVHRLEPRDQPVDARELRVVRGDPRIGLERCSPRAPGTGRHSQVSGARCAGSRARMSCRIVEPVRGRPTTTIGP